MEEAKTISAEENPDIIWDEKVVVKTFEGSAVLGKDDVVELITHVKEKRTENDNIVSTSENSAQESKKLSESELPDYGVGTFVRATFIDGVDYEAEILSINYETGRCRVKYYGYDNEMDVSINNLVPSWGYKARKMQGLKAEEEKRAENEEKEHAAAEAIYSHFSKTLPPPPMPPMPPMIDDEEEDAEHMSAMLMSWYMSGYYTGIYRGIRMGRQEERGTFRKYK